MKKKFVELSVNDCPTVTKAINLKKGSSFSDNDSSIELPDLYSIINLFKELYNIYDIKNVWLIQDLFHTINGKISYFRLSLTIELDGINGIIHLYISTSIKFDSGNKELLQKFENAADNIIDLLKNILSVEPYLVLQTINRYDMWGTCYINIRQILDTGELPTFVKLVTKEIIKEKRLDAFKHRLSESDFILLNLIFETAV